MAEGYAFLSRYKAENAAQMAYRPPAAVFLGDSITEMWPVGDPTLFGETVISRGIGGQTTSHMLLRFYQDAVMLRPALIHLMAGTNDVAENDGPISDHDLLNNVRAMLDIARVHQIPVALASIPPMAFVPWRSTIPGIASRVVSLNDQMRALAGQQGAFFVDYHRVLRDDFDALRTDLGPDGVHLNAAGYLAMRPLAQQILPPAAPPDFRFG